MLNLEDDVVETFEQKAPSGPGGVFVCMFVCVCAAVCVCVSVCACCGPGGV